MREKYRKIYTMYMIIIALSLLTIAYRFGPLAISKLIAYFNAKVVVVKVSPQITTAVKTLFYLNGTNLGEMVERYTCTVYGITIDRYHNGTFAPRPNPRSLGTTLSVARSLSVGEYEGPSTATLTVNAFCTNVVLETYTIVNTKKLIIVTKYLGSKNYLHNYW